MTIKWLIVGLALIFLAASCPAHDKAFKRKVYGSSLQLYMLERDIKDGGSGKQVPEPGCTAQVFQKTEGGYRLLSAAHCVVNKHGGPFPYDEPAPAGTLFASYGDPVGDPVLIPVTVEIVGKWHEGWDVSVLDMNTTADLPVISFGDDTKLEMGDKLVSVSAPLGGEVKYWYEGYVSATKSQINPALTQRVRGWKGTIFIQLPGTFGSSGASVISVDQQAIIGVFTGQARGGDFDELLASTMVPISVVKEFMAHPELYGMSLPKPIPLAIPPAKQ